MTITPITDDLWPDILRIQREAYSTIEPESLEVMRGKWLHSPELCFVCRDPDEGICAYVLAHRWHSLQPPKLHQPLESDSGGAVLFLHDLSISRRLAGRGVGKQLAERVLNRARAVGLHSALLVSIQSSQGFWARLGFQATTDDAGTSYGEQAQIMVMDLG